MANKKVSHAIRTTVIGTDSNTFEIIKENLEDKASAGDEVAIIQLYPTIGIEEAWMTDSTTLHLQNKMHQLGWSKVHILNLFSKITKRKPLAGELKTVDKENMTYIKNILSDIGKRGKIIICWGNSHSTNLTVNESKKEILEFLQKSQAGNTYQLVAEHMTTDTEGTHILFLGLRHADEEWHLMNYPVRTQLDQINALVQKRKTPAGNSKSPKEKDTSKRKDEKQDVSENHE